MQTAIALLSGEAELCALVNGAAQSYGIMAMLADFGLEVSCAVCTDASTAIGMVHRQGLGKTKHIDAQYLWIQKDVLEGKLGVVKVGTDANPADLMAKYLRAEVANAFGSAQILHLYWPPAPPSCWPATGPLTTGGSRAAGPTSSRGITENVALPCSHRWR